MLQFVPVVSSRSNSTIEQKEMRKWWKTKVPVWNIPVVIGLIRKGRSSLKSSKVSWPYRLMASQNKNWYERRLECSDHFQQKLPCSRSLEIGQLWNSNFTFTLEHCRMLADRFAPLDDHLATTHAPTQSPLVRNSSLIGVTAPELQRVRGPLGGCWSLSAQPGSTR